MMRRTGLFLALAFSPMPAHAAAPTPAPAKIGVAASILPLAYLAEGVGRGMVEVSVMVPPGGNPHTYEPTPLQLARLSRAGLYVKAGSGLEFELAWMDKLAALNRGMRVCDASRDIVLLDMEGECAHGAGGAHGHDHGAAGDRAERVASPPTLPLAAAGGNGGVEKRGEGEGEEGHAHRHGKDPHFWLSPANASAIANTIRDALAEVDPARAADYAANARALTAELERLDGELRETLAPARGKAFIVFHPAWGYFADRYGLTQVPIEAGGKEPTARQLAAVVARARGLGARAVFASPEFSRKTAGVIAREIGGKVVMIDALAKDYPGTLRRAAAAIAREAR